MPKYNIEPNYQGLLFYDWYSVSFEYCPELFGQKLLSSLYYENYNLVSCTPRNGFTYGFKIIDKDEKVWVTVFSGGDSQNGKINAFASGDTAERFYAFLQDNKIEYSLLRADIALDFNHVGAWSDLYNICVFQADRFNIKKLFVGSPESLTTPDCEEGRTLYLGSRQSVSFVRLYEKGKKDNIEFPDWVRLELEFKPKNKNARLQYAKASKMDILNASAFVDSIYSQFIEVGIAPCAAGTVRELPDYEKTLLHLFKQYGNFFDEGLKRHKGDLFGFFEEGKAMVDKYKIG